jgi:hypothetical protein
MPKSQITRPFALLILCLAIFNGIISASAIYLGNTVIPGAYRTVGPDPSVSYNGFIPANQSEAPLAGVTIAFAAMYPYRDAFVMTGILGIGLSIGLLVSTWIRSSIAALIMLLGNFVLSVISVIATHNFSLGLLTPILFGVLLWLTLLRLRSRDSGL